MYMVLLVYILTWKLFLGELKYRESDKSTYWSDGYLRKGLGTT